MIEKLIEALKEDAEYYYAWQSNIAVAMQDAYSRATDKTDIHKISNEGAKAFLNILLTTDKEKSN